MAEFPWELITAALGSFAAGLLHTGRIRQAIREELPAALAPIDRRVSELERAHNRPAPLRAVPAEG